MLRPLLACLGMLLIMSNSFAESAIKVLGKDFKFPNRIEGLPHTLSHFSDLEIQRFKTSDGVELAYWEAGQKQAQPLIFIPGWSASGADYVNVMYLLSKNYHVFVLDPRNQGLSQRVEHGGRISRFSMDLKEFSDHLGLAKADYVGWSMGAAVLWSYIDLFGTRGIKKAVFVDEPVSIYAHQDWSEQERIQAGGTTTSPERMVAGFTRGEPLNSLVTDLLPWQRAALKDSPYYANSSAFASEFIKNDPQALGRVLFDHIMNDWRDVIRSKIDIPVAIFTGEESNNLPSQRWIHSTLPGSKLYVYTSKEQGDHFLMLKNPVKFTADLASFLSDGTAHSPHSYRLSGVKLQSTTYLGGPALELRMPSSSYQDASKETLSDRDFMAWLPVDFHDGTVEVDIASDLAPDAPDYARGFVGLTFRIDDQGRFESIYLRPTNSNADEQSRRDHTVQYVAYPDFRFNRLRAEAPGKYETHANIGLGRWIHMKLVVVGNNASLFLDNDPEPTLVVNDLRLGPRQHGGVGIWLESGTVAHFRNLVVKQAD